jgi:hypothetical protein
MAHFRWSINRLNPAVAGLNGLNGIFSCDFQFSWSKPMQLIESIFDLIIFNGRPLAALVRLTQTISGRLGRI